MIQAENDFKWQLNNNFIVGFTWDGDEGDAPDDAPDPA